MKASEAPRPQDIPKREVLGAPLALTDYEQAMAVMDGMISRRERGYVCAVAVHAVMVGHQDTEMLAALRGSALTVPDGRPLVWALNLLGERLEDRVYGPKLMECYCRRCAQAGHRIWLYGGDTPAALDDLKSSLMARYEGIAIAGAWSPPHRPLRPDEEDEVVRRINGDRPDVVWVGTGVPRQEKWMARMLPRLECPVMVGVGAAFDFLAGTKRQAPPWMQRLGLEWVYRAGQEPRRLVPRYLRYNPAFVAAFSRQYMRERGVRWH